MPFELVEDTPGPLNPSDGGPPDLPLGLQPKESTIPLKNRLITGGAIGASMLAPELIAPVMAGSRLLGPLLARPALNTAAQAAIGGTESALKGQDPTWGATAAGGLQGLMEMLSNIPRIGKMVKAGSATQKAYTEAEAARKAATEAAQTAQTTSHEEAVRAHAEAAADTINRQWKEQVPSWQELEDGTRGLLDMVYGKGQELVSKSFDAALKAVKAAAKGAPDIMIRSADAEELGLLPKEPLLVESKIPGQTTGLIPVNPAKLIDKTVGRWKTDRALYNRMFKALDKAGFGNEEARAEYKAAQALINITDKTKALQGEVFHPERIVEGFTKLKTLNEIRNRGQGDIFTGPLQAARGTPEPPPEIPPFKKGPLVSPDVTMLNKPYHLPSLLGLGGGALGYSMGPGGHIVGSGLGMLTGMGAGMMMPTHVPVGNIPPDFLSAAGMDLPTLIQTYLRQQIGQ